jgi:hypothetical protein
MQQFGPAFPLLRGAACVHTEFEFNSLFERDGMAIKYGLAEYDLHTGMFDWNINLPMDGVQSGFLYEFFRSAGENGWELCATFPCGVKGMMRATGTKGEVKVCEDPAEEVAFIFKHVE